MDGCERFADTDSHVDVVALDIAEAWPGGLGKRHARLISSSCSMRRRHPLVFGLFICLATLALRGLGPVTPVRKRR